MDNEPFRVESRLAEFRQAARLTQTDLAELSGVSRETISMIERGNTLPSLTIAMRLADALSTSVEELFVADVSRTKGMKLIEMIEQHGRMCATGSLLAARQLNEIKQRLAGEGVA